MIFGTLNDICRLLGALLLLRLVHAAANGQMELFLRQLFYFS